MHKLTVTFWLALVLWLTGCTKTIPVVDEEEMPGSGGTPTAIGNPVGNATIKTIGAEGGTLTSLDKKLILTVPAGAITTATAFSIQPIENFAPNGLGQAYRLLPEGLHFEKPVTLTFRYDDSLLTGSVAECLFIAYQGENKIWLAQETTLDEASKTVSVSSSHFSDWSLFANFRLSVARSFIDPNESTTLVVKEVDFLLADLKNGKPMELITSRKVSNWTLAGEGRLTPNGAKATYTAPADAPAMNPVTVSAEINNLVTSKGKKAKVMVLAPITIGGDFMDVIFGGVSYHITLCTTQMVGPYLMLNAVLPDMIGVDLNIAGAQVGWYPVQHKEGSTYVVIAMPGDKLYIDSYADCPPAVGIHYTEASVTITKIGKVGEYVEGWFGGEVVGDVGDCGHEIKSVSGSFAIRRRM